MNPFSIHEYPEGADQRTLLQYKIAVMQAFLDGGKIEMLNDRCWEPFRRPGYSPCFDWRANKYRVAAPKIAPGHNPEKLTEEQVGTADGWRLLTEEEHGVGHRRVEDTQYYSSCSRKWSGTDRWWTGHEALRTKNPPGHYLLKSHWTDKLPREYAELAKKRRQEYVARPGRREDLDDHCLMWSFIWEDTPEGHDFWAQVRDYIEGARADLPPIPPSSVLPPPQPAKLAPKKLVPLTPETLPLPCVVRPVHGTGGRWVVTYAGPDGVFMGTGHKETSIHSWEDLAKDFEYSIDHGKTWHPCTRES